MASTGKGAGLWVRNVGSRREEHGEGVLLQLYRRAAAPFPAQTREQQQPGAGVALTSKHGADPDVQSRRLQGGTTRLPVCFVMTQEPEKNLLNHYQLFMCHFWCVSKQLMETSCSDSKTDTLSFLI